MNKVIVSIIIPCFNCEKYITKCIDSILKSGFDSYEIILVNDNSKDFTVKKIKSFLKHKNVLLINNYENLGAAASRNIGVNKSSGKYLLFVDADTEIETNTLREIINEFSKNIDLGAAQLKIINKNTKLLETAGHFISFIGLPYEIGVNEDEKKYQDKIEILGARSAGMVVRRDVFNKVKGFDEDYIIYGEETDLCWRIWISGFKIVFLPNARIYHASKSSLTKQTNYRIFYEGSKNNLSNIIKNAPVSVAIWIIPLNLTFWIILSLKQMLYSRFSNAMWIYRGIWWNVANLIHTTKKREIIQSLANKNNQTTKLLLGDISLSKLVIKGYKWFFNI